MASDGLFAPHARITAFARQTFGPDAKTAMSEVTTVLPVLPLSELQDPERLAAAMLMLADGDLDRLARAIDLAERDWRDLLVAAGLANGDWPDVLTRTLGPRKG